MCPHITVLRVMGIGWLEGGGNKGGNGRMKNGIGYWTKRGQGGEVGWWEGRQERFESFGRLDELNRREVGGLEGGAREFAWWVGWWRHRNRVRGKKAK